MAVETLLAITFLGAAVGSTAFLALVKGRWLLSLWRHRNLLFIITSSHHIFVKPFKVTANGIRFKIGRTVYEKNFRAQEKLSWHGKSVFIIGIPSGLPLNVELALGEHPSKLEAELDASARQLMAERGIREGEDPEKVLAECKMKVLQQLDSVVRESKILKLTEWFSYLNHYSDIRTEEAYWTSKFKEYLSFMEEGRFRNLIYYAIIFFLLVVGTAFAAKIFGLI
jgi:hypothetical protein